MSSSIDSFTEALDGLKQGYETGRLAHAYLIVGSPRGNALAFAESFLQFLFCREKNRPCGKCSECERVKQHEHPDVMWLQPETKSRKIDIDQIREELTPRISRTSYGGGYKVGVILHADRLTEGAANAFLKTLEEPPGSSLLLLVTNSVQNLLPTIVSRCQRIVLSAVQDEEGPWQAALLDVLRCGPPQDSIEALVQSGRLKAILNDVKKAVTEEAKSDDDETSEENEEAHDARIAARVLEVRTAVMRQLLLWKRDVLMTVVGAGDEVLHFEHEKLVIHEQARKLNYAQAMRQVEAVEGIIRRLERNLPDETVFEVGLRGSTGAAPVRMLT
jgi:DNA polymerase III delta' subunit